MPVQPKGKTNSRKTTITRGEGKNKKIRRMSERPPPPTTITTTAAAAAAAAAK